MEGEMEGEEGWRDEGEGGMEDGGEGERKK